MNLKDSVRSLWTSTGFMSHDLTAYAERLIATETRQGVINVSLFSLLLLGGAAILYAVLGMGESYAYTYAALAALSLHILITARSALKINVLYLLGTVLLVIIGVGLVLLAHQARSFSGTLFAAVALLFMVVPMVPWGLRDAGIVTVLIYGVFTGSTLSVWGRFNHETLWTLQFLMVSAGLVSLVLVVRAVALRKHDIEARYELERSHRDMQRLSLEDALTGAGNRRALSAQLPQLLREARESGEQAHFVVIDIDHFKHFNDTHGHQRGDELLRVLARRFSSMLSPGELLVRMGGDEFVVVLRGSGPAARLQRAAESFRCDAQALGHGPAGQSAPMLSMGVAAAAPDREPGFKQLYGQADAALYRAKSSGRNSIECYTPERDAHAA
jgi:diguanylate cyclase (GGDEF)-like protein